MARFAGIALVLLSLVPGSARAIEIKNARLLYGLLGVERPNNKFLPGDYLYMTFDIEGVEIEAKTGLARYLIVFRVDDSRGKLLLKKETPTEVLPSLGGNRLPGVMDLTIDRKQPPGKYFIKLEIQDRVSKQSSEFNFDFEVLPLGFGLVGVSAPALGFPGQTYGVSFTLVDTPLDTTKKPQVEVTMKVYDEARKEVMKPVASVLPRDLPAEIDLQKDNVVPMQFPVYLNRPGRFSVEVDINEKVTNQVRQLRIPLTVLDLAKIGK